MEKISDISTKKLAFLGDAFFEFLVRKELVLKYNDSIGNLNKLKNSIVCCEEQSEIFSKIENLLTEKEILIYKKGRNLNCGRVPKKSKSSVYRRATGFEALFGYLCLTNNIERAYQFLTIINI